MLFIAIYYPSCLIAYDSSFTVPFMLKKLSSVKNFAIRRSINECPGVIYFMRADFVFASRVPFVIINIKGRLFP